MWNDVIRLGNERTVTEQTDVGLLACDSQARLPPAGRSMAVGARARFLWGKLLRTLLVGPNSASVVWNIACNTGTQAQCTQHWLLLPKPAVPSSNST